jgi:hypothetical protein
VAGNEPGHFERGQRGSPQYAEAKAAAWGPVLAIPDRQGQYVGLFGPIVTPAPMGEDAANLWDAYVTMVQTPGFVEIKRTRDVEPQFD